MAPRLVFVHGIGGQRSAEIECNRWASALAEGARQAGHQEAADGLVSGSLVETVFADYSDLFQKPHGQGSGYIGDDEDMALLVDLLAEMIESHNGGNDRSTDVALTRALAQLRPHGDPQGSGDPIRRAINAATTLLGVGPCKRSGQWASGKLLIRDLAQVNRYLARGEPGDDHHTLDMRIRHRVREAFGPGPTVVVAHSLGSIVSFEALHAESIEISLWVTLGSPLAMRSVVWPKIRPRPPATPSSVMRWLNYWDRDDIIVPRPILESDFAPNMKGVMPVSRRVDSDGIWAHSVTKYLARADVAGPVAETIQSYARESRKARQ